MIGIKPKPTLSTISKIFSRKICSIDNQWMILIFPIFWRRTYHNSVGCISEEQILKAINDLEPVKASGLDGYLILFFRKYWSILKDNIMGTIAEFNTQGKISSLHNATFISLLHKKNHVESVFDLRHISLLTSM